MAMSTIYDWNFASPTAISREEYEDVGASAFFLGDVQRAFKGSTDFEIWTASSGGTQLVEDTDYTLSATDTDYSSEAGFSVYYNLTVTNATYQTGSIFITYDILGSYVTAALLNDILTDVSSGVLSGEIKSFGGTATPSGFLPCDGTAVSRTTYSDLFTAISTTWGVGDGSTTFNVPDLRGSFLRGAGANGTETMSDGNPYDGGSVGDSNDDAMQRITGVTGQDIAITTYQDSITSGVFTPSTGATSTAPLGTQAGSRAGSSTVDFDSSTSTSPNTARTSDTETRPFNNSVLYIIKT